jgi:hypothetical protein
MDVLTRILKLRDHGRDVEITVRISWPGQEQRSWACRWEIIWPDRRRSNFGRGTDAVQALISALQMVGSELYFSDEHRSGNLWWVEKWVGYGFPVPNNIRDLLVGDDKTSF